MSDYEVAREIALAGPLPTPESVPCRVPGGHAVSEWVYDTEGTYAKAIGECRHCDAMIVCQLPRAVSVGWGPRDGWTQWGYDKTVAEKHRLGYLAAVSIATHEALKPRGGRPRLPFDDPKTTFALAGELLFEVMRLARRDVVKQMEDRERWVKQEQERTDALQEECFAESLKPAIARMQAQLANLRRDRSRLAKEVQTIDKRIQAERAAARREPLPVPADYTPPALGSLAILCDYPTPPEVVYALVDPRDPELVRYVGRTCDPVGRYNGHVSSGSASVSAWVESLKESGVFPVMLLLERCTAEEVGQREAYWIAHYRAKWQADLNASIPKLRIA